MTELFIAQLGAGLLAAAAPWIVVRAALAAAARHFPAGAPLVWPVTARRLAWATALLLPSLFVAALLLPARAAWVPAAGGAAFVALAVVALRALHEIDAASRPARDAAATTRIASLEPRRARRYLPWARRVLPWAVALAGGGAFVARLGFAAGDRRLLLPVILAAAAAVFLGLYEAWIHEVVTGPSAPAGVADPEVERRARVRRLNVLQLALVAVLLGAAHGLLDLDWSADGGRGAAMVLAAGLMGVFGCGRAIASTLERRGPRLAGTAP